MNENTETKERKREIAGGRPPGVIGEMHPEKIHEMLKEWRAEGSIEEEKRTWAALDRILRENPIRI